MPGPTKRFHISISTTDFNASLRDYTVRLDAEPDVVIPGRYARWRTDLLNFSISCKPDQTGGIIRHIGFEDDSLNGFTEEQDANGVTWEYFDEPSQQEEIGKLKAAMKQG
jgi:catechol 2,3-dioxygenase-like lactoylglutathione lyase family enzyme